MMISFGKKKLKHYVSAVICLSLALAVFPLTGKAASDSGSEILDTIINANNPLPVDGQALLDGSSKQPDNADGKSNSNKSNKEKLKDQGNSTSRKSAIVAD